MSLLSRLAVRAARAYGMLAQVSAPTNVSVEYLVVAGGGGAGDNLGGAGGAGGLLTSTTTLSTLNTYSITVGAGGVGGASGDVNGSNGSNSVISGTGLTTITAIGGGGGAGNAAANSGGSGGGGSSSSGSTGGAGTSGQGNAGGTTPSGTYWQAASGGGGAGAAGTGRSASASTGGNGGNGIQSSISGTATYYAGGGAGGAGTGFGTGTVGTAGLGGGGIGKLGDSGGKGGNGGVNLGGGGGGGGTAGGDGGDGGSGIVIISYTSATPKFVGGTITTSGGKQIHTFTSSGTLSPITPITASYLVVAGGGGGGQGGGGAGGLLTSSTTLYSGASYVVTVGAGGTAGTNQAAGANGSNSVVSGTGLTTLTATGGGGGGYFSAVAGASGGSGGGGGGSDAGGGVGAGGAGTSGQGNAGGSGVSQTTTNGGGGGGGAGAAGGNAVASSYGGQGGIGVQSSISGTATYYAGGGSGGCSLTTTGGQGGGGSGGAASSAGTAGTTNTGGGGGGGGNTTGGIAGGAGGSGIVIISYAGSQVFNGGLVTSSGGNTIHTFTSTGALTPLTNNLNNSLRFRGSNSAYLNRTPTVAGNRKTWTWSAWIKLGTISVNMGTLFIAQGQTAIYLNDGTYSSFRVNGAAGSDLITSMMPRDPSAWYHLVVACDTTQAVEANRLKIYVNGVQQTAFQAGSTYPTLNGDTYVNSTAAHYIGRRVWNSDQQYDGYMTDINFIDGQALEPYYFGNNDANGVWKPILYKGTYGTNGFYLTFGNTTSTTTIGYDSSPNGNNWTTNNISLTAGTTYDAMTDVPTNTSATVANYATLNPLWINSNLTLAGANLNVTSSGNGGTAISTIAMESGKYYCEVTINTGSDATNIGIVNSSFNPSLSSPTLSGVNAVGYYGSSGDKFVNGTQSAYGASYTTGDIIGIALDITAGTVTFYKNNTSQGAITHGLTGPFYFATSDVSSGSNINQSWNFGQRPFSYTPPTGYVALNTYNLPTPTILQGNKYMDATLWTGDGTSSRSITNAALFRPDFVWIKNRSRDGADPYYGVHMLFNTVTGAGNRLMSQSTTSEIYSASSLTAFNSNGFSVGSDLPVNRSGDSFVGWQWQAGQGSTSSNTSGSITSTVSVNTTAGFSVVTYTGTGSTKTFGHGLGVTPAMFIVKSRSQTGENWVTWHKSFSNTAQGNMALNTTDAVSNSASVWGNTAPTSTLITVGNAAVNNNTSTYVCYAWAEIAGFSKFGSYTGNGSTDGPFVFTGFRPKYVMIKRTDSADDWIVMDSARNTYNVANSTLFPNGSYAETTDANRQEDFLSNGFKVRSSPVYINASGGTYIYAAFAENPFKNANAR